MLAVVVATVVMVVVVGMEVVAGSVRKLLLVHYHRRCTK